MDLEDVSPYVLSDEARELLLSQQRECTLCWVSGGGLPAGVTMSYLWADGFIWLASVRTRKRVLALRRRPTACVVISSAGTSWGPGQSITYQGRCDVLDDRETKDWFFRALADVTLGDSDSAKDGFVKTLDSPNRVVLRVELDHLVNSYDGGKLRAAMAASR